MGEHTVSKGSSLAGTSGHAIAAKVFLTDSLPTLKMAKLVESALLGLKRYPAAVEIRNLIVFVIRKNLPLDIQRCNDMVSITMPNGDSSTWEFDSATQAVQFTLATAQLLAEARLGGGEW